MMEEVSQLRGGASGGAEPAKGQCRRKAESAEGWSQRRGGGSRGAEPSEGEAR